MDASLYCNALPAEFEFEALIETHGSWVFLGKNLVIKVKKPISFGFLSYKTCLERQQNIKNELLRNRLWGASLYLGIVQFPEKGFLKWPLPIEDSLAPNESLQEWGLVMKRIPAQSSLELLCKNQSQPDESLLSALSAKLYTLHSTSERKYQNSPLLYEQFLKSATEETLQTLKDASVIDNDENAKRVLTHLCTWLNNQTTELQNYFSNRAKEGFIRWSHGDLRAEHICIIESQLNFFDGIEFSDQVASLDVLDECAFLFMDLTLIGASNWATMFLQKYIHLCPEAYSTPLLQYYLIYRTLIRTKISYLRALQCEGTEERDNSLKAAHTLLQLGARWLWVGDKPRIFAFSGLMASGKSTLASHLSKLFGVSSISSDTVRKELFNSWQEGKKLAFAEGMYSEHERERVYQEMYARVCTALIRNTLVILDASFSSYDERTRLRALASSLNATVQFIECTTTPELQLERVRTRSLCETENSQGREELLTAQKNAWNPFSLEESAVSLCTQGEVSATIEHLLQKLSPLWKAFSFSSK